MSEDTSQSAAASAKKGGTHFILKMLFLALIVLAIVFYVRSLDHRPPAQAVHVPEPAPPVEPGNAPAPVTAPESPVAAAPPSLQEAGQPESSAHTSVGPGPASAPPATRGTEAQVPATVTSGPAPRPAEAAPPAPVAEAPASTTAGPAPSAETAATAETGAAPEGSPADDVKFRPLTDEDVMRQIQEVFAPETLSEKTAE